MAGTTEPFRPGWAGRGNAPVPRSTDGIHMAGP